VGVLLCSLKWTSASEKAGGGLEVCGDAAGGWENSGLVRANRAMLMVALSIILIRTA
jgi:hypothetical protein